MRLCRGRVHLIFQSPANAPSVDQSAMLIVCLVTLISLTRGSRFTCSQPMSQNRRINRRTMHSSEFFKLECVRKWGIILRQISSVNTKSTESIRRSPVSCYLSIIYFLSVFSAHDFQSKLLFLGIQFGSWSCQISIGLKHNAKQNKKHDKKKHREK